MRTFAAVLIGLLYCGAVSAEVLAAAAQGFSLRVVTTTKADPATAYQAFVQIGRWWDPAHTYFGEASGLSLDVRPGGAFLEVSPSGAFVTHMRLVYANPGREIRLLGGLGPLQPMGLHGALNVAFEAGTAGDSKVTMTYNVSGFTEGGLESLAPIVDRVQTEQMRRHAVFADQLAAQD